MKINAYIFFLLIIGLFSCNNDDDTNTPDIVTDPDLTIFFVNDQHGWIFYYPKVKAIVDEAEHKGYTIAEAVIGYLQDINPTINIEDCSRVMKCER